MKTSGFMAIPECTHNLLAVQDTLNVLSDKVDRACYQRAAS
jgi:hypothetical protein